MARLVSNLEDECYYDEPKYVLRHGLQILSIRLLDLPRLSEVSHKKPQQEGWSNSLLCTSL